MRVKAAGVGNWDALIREGKVQLQPLPLTLGSELAGIVEGIGANVSCFNLGDEVYGATNEQFSGGYAEHALPFAKMIARKPKTLNFIEAASAPIVTVTAWQMLFENARVTAGQTVLVHSAAGKLFLRLGSRFFASYSCVSAMSFCDVGATLTVAPALALGWFCISGRLKNKNLGPIWVQ